MSALSNFLFAILNLWCHLDSYYTSVHINIPCICIYAFHSTLFCSFYSHFYLNFLFFWLYIFIYTHFWLQCDKFLKRIESNRHCFESTVVIVWDSFSEIFLNNFHTPNTFTSQCFICIIIKFTHILLAFLFTHLRDIRILRKKI